MIWATSTLQSHDHDNHKHDDVEDMFISSQKNTIQCQVIFTLSANAMNTQSCELQPMMLQD